MMCQHAQMTFLVRLVVNAFAIWLAAAWVSGIDISSSGNGTAWDIVVLLGIALVFTVVNIFVKPLVKLLSLPLLILTLGLFTLVINALMVMLTAWLSSQTDYGMTVDGFWTALWGGLIISVVNFLVNIVVPDRD
ncbi:putative membrane protein [Rhodococcus sp. WAY2]|nr:putative membrane protein [Rhodococcus sp. WAY2]